MSYKKVNSVLQTKSYKRFKFAENNRDIDPKKVQQQIKNMQRTRNEMVIPIFVKEEGKDLVVLEGQHRLVAARIMKIPVNFVIVKNIEYDDIPELQTNGKWKPLDFVKSFAKKGIQSYVFLRDVYLASKLTRQYKVSLGSFGIFFNDMSFTSSQLKKGELIITEEQKERFHNNVDKVISIFDSRPDKAKQMRSEVWLKVLWHMIQRPDYNHEHMKYAVANANDTMFVPSRVYSDMQTKLIAIYNSFRTEAPIQKWEEN